MMTKEIPSRKREKETSGQIRDDGRGGDNAPGRVRWDCMQLHLGEEWCCTQFTPELKKTQHTRKIGQSKFENALERLREGSLPQAGSNYGFSRWHESSIFVCLRFIPTRSTCFFSLSCLLS